MLEPIKALTSEECIYINPFGVSGMVVFMPEGGEWVDDSNLLFEKWEHGWDMRALNYCIDTSLPGGRFGSM